MGGGNSPPFIQKNEYEQKEKATEKQAPLFIETKNGGALYKVAQGKQGATPSLANGI